MLKSDWRRYRRIGAFLIAALAVFVTIYGAVAEKGLHYRTDVYVWGGGDSYSKVAEAVNRSAGRFEGFKHNRRVCYVGFVSNESLGGLKVRDRFRNVWETGLPENGVESWVLLDNGSLNVCYHSVRGVQRLNDTLELV